MTEVRTAPAPRWRTLKEIVAHYMKDSKDSDGRSGADVIRLCFKERERCDRLFASVGKSANDRLLYEKDIQALDELMEKTRVRIHRLVSEQAKDGKWIAMGRHSPQTEHELIPPGSWPFLTTLDIDNNAVLGDELSFRDLRCSLTKDIPEDDPIRETLRRAQQPIKIDQQHPAATHQQPVSAPSTEPAQAQEMFRTGFPGRPSGKHLVQAEFARRCRDTKILPSLGAEAKYLAAWLRSDHPNVPHPTPKTIANNLRSEYRAAKARLGKCPKL